MRIPIAPRLYESREVADPNRTGDTLIMVVMDRIIGEPLGERMIRDRGILDPQRLAPILSHALAQISLLAEHGVYHLCLAPGNLMICSGEVEGRAVEYGYVIDYSIAAVSKRLQKGRPEAAPVKGYFDKKYGGEPSEQAVVRALADTFKEFPDAARRLPGLSADTQRFFDVLDRILSLCTIGADRSLKLAEIGECFERLSVISQGRDCGARLEQFRGELLGRVFER